LTAFLGAFGLIFVAELGDKSMLLVVTLATRYRWWVVLAAIAISASLLMAVAVLLGGAAAEVLPDWLIAAVAGALFIGFGVWTLTRNGEDTESIETRARSPLLAVAALSGALVLAELGDKTQIATLSIAGLNPDQRWAVWAGATAGLIVADAIALAAGGAIARVIAPVTLRRVAGLAFVVFGLLILATLVI
jgi:Ca2+/H+ antiporter, TMEM165/GDT1 family